MFAVSKRARISNVQTCCVRLFTTIVEPVGTAPAVPPKNGVVPVMEPDMTRETGSTLDSNERRDDSSAGNDYDEFDVCPSMASSVCAIFFYPSEAFFDETWILDRQTLEVRFGSCQNYGTYALIRHHQTGFWVFA